MGNHIQVELPPDFCYSKVRGYGICVVLTPKKFCGREDYYDTPSYNINMDNFDWNTTVRLCGFYGPIGIPKSDITWFRFTNRENWNLKTTHNFVAFSFIDNDDINVEVKEFGVRLVFDEDIKEEMDLNIIRDLPTPTQDGGTIGISRRFQYFAWSW